MDQGLLMAVAGVGVEIVDGDKLPDPRRNPDHYLQLLTKAEWDYCLTQAHPVIHIAARIAAKRAAVKALGIDPPRLDALEVVREESGAVRLDAHSLSSLRTHLTITHEGPLALAVVIAESPESI